LTASARIIVRNLLSGEIEAHEADAVILASGGLFKTYFIFDQCYGLRGDRRLESHKRGAYFANPCLHADPPDLHSRPWETSRS